MFRWLLTIFLVVLILSSALPWLRRFGIGRLPGDLNFRLFGRNFHLPFASTIIISLVALVIARLV